MMQGQEGVEASEFNAVPVDLLGRFMRPDHTEFPCRIDSMSPAEASVLTTSPPQVAERIIVYADHVGRLEGIVTELFTGGFSMSTAATERKRERLAAQLTWLCNRDLLNLPEDRRHERLQPENPFRDIILADGRRYKVKIIDLSLSGAAVQSSVRPALGSQITLGAMPGRVVRNLEDGFALEFSNILAEDSMRRLFR